MPSTGPFKGDFQGDFKGAFNGNFKRAFIRIFMGDFKWDFKGDFEGYGKRVWESLSKSTHIFSKIDIEYYPKNIKTHMHIF